MSQTPTSLFADAPVISRYTREKAIEDGHLVIIPSDIRAEAGIVHPAAMTSQVFDLVNPTSSERTHGQSQDGRLWDLAWMMRLAMGSARRTNVVQFKVIFLVDGSRDGVETISQRTATLSVHCGPGDTPAPVLTVKLVSFDDEPLYTEPCGC